MGLEVGTLALIATATTSVANLKSQADARQSAAQSRDEQLRAQYEQRAVVASNQAADRRAQIREERVRRARVMQASENSGTAYSSGESGALGSISTQFATNTGRQLGNAQASANISNFQQNAANFNFETQQSLQEAQMFTQLGGLTNSIFDMYAKPQKIIPKTSNAGTTNPQMTTADYLAVRDQ